MLRNDLSLALCLGLLSILAILPGISGTAVLSQGDEYMHIATVRDSLDSGSYFLPVVNGGTNYHKPPLLFWLGMASEAIFGRSLWAVRFPAVLLGAISVMLVFGTLRTLRVSRYRLVLVALVYLFSLAVTKFGRLLMMEQALVASMLGVVFFFARYMRYRGIQNVFLAGLVSAFAYLYKGPLFQAYSGLFLSVWALCLLWRFDLRPLRWRGRKEFGRVFRVFVVFHVPLIIPVIWIGLAYSASSHGALLMQYFFQFENVGKFLEANQPETRIFGGWLLYSLPWTVFFLPLCFAALRSRVRTLPRFAGWVLFWAAVMFTLLHLLPNRKDTYYVLPAWPLALMGASLLVDFNTKLLRRAALANTAITLLVTLILLPPGIILGAGPAYYFWSLIAIAITVGVLARWKQLPVSRRYAGMIAAGVSTMAAFQFAFLPLVDRPDAPVGMRDDLAEKLCIVSNETWDGFVFKSLLPAHDIHHAVPTLPEGCGESDRGIIVLRVENYSPPPGYTRAASWSVWKTGLGTNEIFAGLKNPDLLQTPILYYTPAQRREANR